MHRLVGLRWRPGHYEGRKAAEAYGQILLATGAWRAALSTRGFLLLIAEDSNDLDVVTLPGGAGVLIGALFSGDKSAYARVTAPAPEACEAWIATEGDALTKSCWGAYLAVLIAQRSDGILVVRDPMGARACFVRDAGDDGVRILFTELEDLSRIAPLPASDDQFIGLFLAQPRLVSERTGLQGVREVLAGECYTMGPTHDKATLAWRPPPRDLALAKADTQTLAAPLRESVLSAAAAWVSLGRPILHRLSGGLDSSIALKALADAGAQVCCVNEWPEGFAEGDERAAARAAAQRFGLPLVELGYRASAIDYRKVLDAPLSAKPSVTELSFADPHFAEFGEAGALLTSGQGGDQVFYRSGVMCTIADAVRDGLAPAAIIALALDAARVSRRSVWPAIAAGIAFGLLRKPEGYVRKILMDAARKNAPVQARAAAEAALADPWVRAALVRGPGEAMRALHIADLQYYHGPSMLSQRLLVTPILTSQPILDYCCAVPTYRTFDAGRDRSHARAAFEHDLPATSIARHTKGDTTRFHAEVALCNADFIVETLRDGQLVKRSLFDHARLDQKPKQNLLDFAHVLAAELWLRRLNAARAQQRHLWTAAA